MHSSTSKPLLTFAVASCNQEAYVREAVEAAFAQTYSPLEIILSDDCSNDRSFDIMQEMAKSYRGPHKILLNRNPVRRVTGGHFNQIVSIASGELIVIAAADDVSLPHRTESIYQAWEQTNRQATSLHSYYVQIDEQGQKIDKLYDFHGPDKNTGRLVEQKVKPLTYVQTQRPSMVGATHAFSPIIFKRFGNLIEDIIHEDDVLMFRTFLGGRLFYVDEPLVKYRVHANNVALARTRRSMTLQELRNEENKVRRLYKNRIKMFNAFLQDLEKASELGFLERNEANELRNEITRRRIRFSLMAEFLDSGPFAKRRILRQLRKNGLDEADDRYLSRRLMPESLLLPIRLACNHGRRLLNRPD